MKKGILICFFISFLSVISAQKLVRIGTLPESISESSGLVFYNDTLLITHNDSGDKPMLYFINLKGKLVGQVLVENATNTDWEDLCMDDKGNLYIADIGNNNNDRRDLKIYKVNSSLFIFVHFLKNCMYEQVQIPVFTLVQDVDFK